MLRFSRSLLLTGSLLFFLNRVEPLLIGFTRCALCFDDRSLLHNRHRFLHQFLGFAQIQRLLRAAHCLHIQNLLSVLGRSLHIDLFFGFFQRLLCFRKLNFWRFWLFACQLFGLFKRCFGLVILLGQLQNLTGIHRLRSLRLQIVQLFFQQQCLPVIVHRCFFWGSLRLWRSLRILKLRRRCFHPRQLTLRPGRERRRGLFGSGFGGSLRGFLLFSCFLSSFCTGTFYNVTRLSATEVAIIRTNRRRQNSRQHGVAVVMERIFID